MDAVETCSSVLEHIRQTKLNFVFSESPFGINISIKKSFRKNTVHVKSENTPASVQIDVLEKSLKNVTQEILTKENTIKDLMSKNEHLKKEIKDIANHLEDYRLSDKRILKQLKNKEKEIYDIKRDLEKEKDKNEIIAMECKELKVELAQEKKEKGKLLKKDIKKKSTNNNNRNEASTQTQILECEICKETFTSETELKYHMTTKHKETSESFSQTSENNLTGRGSQSEVTDKFLQYPCFYCGAIIYSEIHLSQHYVICRDSTYQYQCKAEPQKSNEKRDASQTYCKFFSDLHNHLHPKIPCDKCNETFESQSILQLHKMVSHTGFGKS